jgi:hypothetical protein
VRTYPCAKKVPKDRRKKSEAAVMANVQLESARSGNRWILRNNSGAFMDDTGRQVRFGLGNVSKKFNEHMKSSDLVGIESVVITAEMVGQTIGRFYAVEAKPEDWKYTGTAREVAQLKFIAKVNEMGGKAYFTNGLVDMVGNCPYIDPLVRSIKT